MVLGSDPSLVRGDADRRTIRPWRWRRRESNPTAGGGGASGRRAWLDNLGVLIITGVIGAHVALIHALQVGRAATPQAR